jgi:hypothetical protein
MKKYLLPENGNFYKANLHCHTTISDGRLTPEEVNELYKSNGYSVVAYTDHNLLIPHNDLTDDTFLALNGLEMDTNEHEVIPCPKYNKTNHVCYIALEPDNFVNPMWHRNMYKTPGHVAENADKVIFDESKPDYFRRYSHEGISEMMNIGREEGFFVTYNHPTWSKETYAEYTGFKGMHAMEMVNGSCLTLGYDEHNHRVYDDILRNGNRIYAIGTDDNHNKYPFGTKRCDSCVAWTMIKAEKLDYKTVTDALLAGNFYASEGPEIYELTFDDLKVHIKTSPAEKIQINYMTRGAGVVFAEDEPITEATFVIPDDIVYFRLTVIDERGKCATTNAYFLDELVK